MCGIVGYIGKEEAAPLLLEGLKKLEYRGYDSAGICVHVGYEGLAVVKTKGRVEELEKLVQQEKDVRGATMGIGHTRWATHGEPSERNSHPHVSWSGKIAAVHNGIIENYLELKEMLMEKGVEFTSDTDTEVVVQLIDYFYQGDLLQAVQRAVAGVEGSYALGIMCVDDPETIIAVRKDSPLILAHTETGNFLASDVMAVLSHTREVTYLEDGEFAILKPDSVVICDAYMQEVKRPQTHIDWDVSAAEKGGYPYFMFKEILEQPEAFKQTVMPRIRNGRIHLDDLQMSPEYVRGLDKIYIVACGSSYHVGVVAKYNIEKMVRKPVEVALASEFLYCDPIVTEKTLVICISQSGATADTREALREAKRLGARVLSIVNVMGSTIAVESDDVLYTWAGPEIAVATTKAYSTQLAVTYLLTLYMAECCGTISEERYTALLEELQQIPEKLQKIVDDREHIQYLASQYFNRDDIFFIGRNVDYALSLEGSLKLKEISYIHSEAYAAGELKHGTISLIETGTLVIAVATYTPLIPKTKSNAVEAKTRGAEILLLATAEGKKAFEDVTKKVIEIPEASELFIPSLAVIPLQLFAYYVALQRGCDVDKPRNLAKSVTVE